MSVARVRVRSIDGTLRSLAGRLPLPLFFFVRAARIAMLTLGLPPAFLVCTLFSPDAAPRLLRWYFQSCGGTFLKVGQVLAVRYDLLPPAYCEELSRLLDKLPPDPVDEILAILEADLGGSVLSRFARFSPEPLAAASIAQIHEAELAGGERVVVKVLRPGIERRFQIDFLFLRILARLFQGRLFLTSIDLRATVEELIDLTREELDFRREARNLEQMHEVMLRDEVDHYTPRIYPELCGRAVLTMERIDGVSVKQILTALEAGDLTLLETWRDNGIDPETVAWTILRSLLTQILRYRLFHADPHPANLIVMPGGVLGWVDFGMLGWLDEKAWLEQFRMRLAVAESRIDNAYQSLLATLDPPPSADLSRFEVEVKGYIRDWIVSAHSPAASLIEKSAGHFLLRTFGAIRRTGIRVPLGTLRLYRTMVIGDIVILKLAPRTNFWIPLREFLEEEKQRLAVTSLGEMADLSRAGSMLQDLLASPRVAFELLDLGVRRLARGNRQERSGLERGAELIFVWLRTAVLVGTAGAAGLLLLGPQGSSGGTWARLEAAVRSGGWTAVVLGAVASHLLAKLIRELRRGR
ncbi:MAG: ABC1 kinase family protein [Thermoanaerobaculia bacterium]